MRRLRSQQFNAASVQEVLDEFSKQMAFAGIKESDVLSVSVVPGAAGGRSVSEGGVNYSTVQVLIVYWSDK